MQNYHTWDGNGYSPRVYCSYAMRLSDFFNPPIARNNNYDFTMAWNEIPLTTNALMADLEYGYNKTKYGVRRSPVSNHGNGVNVLGR